MIRKKKARIDHFAGIKYDYPPVTSADQVKAVITARNAKNKQRAKSMERRIAETLRGRRVPMSGAHAAYKGDVEIPFVQYPGKYIIECKLSAAVTTTGESQLRLQYEWLEKIRIEAENMGARFGVLIIHYHGNNRDYVFINVKVVDMLTRQYDSVYNDIIKQLMTTAPILDIRTTKGGKVLKACMLKRSDLDSHMMQLRGLEGMRLLAADQEYLVMPLDSFKTIVYHL
jgi:hypothetical protein